MTAWVSVAERRPLPGVPVLIVVPGAINPVWVGWYELAVSGWVDSEGYPVTVSHWAPLPAPPAK